MLTTQTEHYAAQFAAVNEEVIATVEGCTDEQWRRTCASEGWSVAGVAHHIATVQGAFARIIETLAKGGDYSPTMSATEVDQMNARHAEEYAAVGKPETLALLRSTGAALAQLLPTLGDAQLDRVAGVFGGHEMRVMQVMEWIVIGHARAHLGSIHAALAA